MHALIAPQAKTLALRNKAGQVQAIIMTDSVIFMS